MPTKFEQDRDAQRLARHQRVAQQIKETDRQMSRETSRTLLLYTGDVVPDPDQPRRLYAEDAVALQELAASIRAVGLLSPIQVRPDPQGGGRYVIIVGERRWRACLMAGVNRIEAVVREDWDAFQVRAAQYEENEKRQDVSDAARARSLLAMRHADEDGRRRGWDEVAARVGLQRNQAMRLVGLLQLPEAVVELIDRRLLPGTHGTELVRLLKHVPDDEILALAHSCCAAAPGGKARCPVKELARTVTDRLQAAHEAAHGPGEADAPAGGKGRSPVAAGNAPDQGGGDPGADRPRSFLRELAESWEAGRLRPSERRLIQELWRTHPLEAIAPEVQEMHH